MTVNPLPPQAYTKETLQKAYTWLLNQSPSIKDMATTQDMLVSLYLKAQRSGDASLDTPSIQNFKQELKNLASMMGDLQTTAPRSTAAVPIAAPTPALALSSTPTTLNPQTPHINVGMPQLDPQSLQFVSEIRQSLNLSSDIEALRALIAIGFKQFKKIN